MHQGDAGSDTRLTLTISGRHCKYSNNLASNIKKAGINVLTDQIIGFIKERGWEQFHSPKNLVIAIGAEAGELLECFQWKTDEEITSMVEKEDTQQIADEIADIYMYLVSLCNSMNIDLNHAVCNKLEKNQQKYPVEKSYGSAKKYTKLSGV